MVSLPSSANPSQRSRPRLSWRWLGLLPLLALPLVWPVQFSSRPAEDPTSAPLPVQTQTLEPADSYATERTYTGEITAQRSSDLGFELAGTVVEVLVEEGDVVVAGEALARLDTRTLAAQRQQLVAQRSQAQARFQELQRGPRQEDIAAAESAVQDLQAQLDLARLQQQRRADLYDQGAISREERDEKTFTAQALENRLGQAQSQLDALRAGTRVEQVTAQDAQVDQADANVRSLDVSLAKSVIYAPYGGRVAQRLIDEGAVVSPGQPVVRLVEGSALEARVGVPAAVADQITLGSPQIVQVGGKTLSGTVTALLPELDDTSQTVTVVVALPLDAQPTIGATVRLIVNTEQSASGFWLPTNALVAGERGLWSAYVLAAADEAGVYEVARREVEVLYTEGDRAFVRGLLQPGDDVITSGTHKLVPGQQVIK